MNSVRELLHTSPLFCVLYVRSHIYCYLALLCYIEDQYYENDLLI